MRLHRVIVDTLAATATPVASELVHVDGKRFFRHTDGSLRLVDSERAWAGERFIATAWHSDLAAAYAEAADSLSRRAQTVAALRLTCLAGADVVDGGAA